MNNQPRSITRWVHVIVTLFFMFGFRFLPPFGGLSTISMEVIGVFVGTIYGWIFVDMGWPSLAGMVALGTTSYCTMSELFVNSFGSQTIMMLMGMLFLSAFVQQQGITDVIVDFLLTRKIAKGRPYVILFFFLLAAFAATLLSQCLAMTVLFIAIFRSMMKKTGIKFLSKPVSVFLVGLSFSTIIGDISFPFKNAAIVGLASYESITGIAYNGAKYALVAFPLCILMIVSYVLMCKYILRIDLSGLVSADLDLELTETTPKKKLGLILTIIALVTLLLPSTLPAGWAFTQFLNRLGLGGIAILMVAILGLVRYQGEPLLDFGEIAGFFQWKVLLVQALLVPLASAISSEAVGITQLISGGFASITRNLPVAALIIVTVFIVCLATNFANNIIIGTLFITILIPVTESLGNPGLMQTLLILIIFAANVALILPSACPVNCVIFGQNDIVDRKYQTFLGIITSLMFCALLCLVGFALVAVHF